VRLGVLWKELSITLAWNSSDLFWKWRSSRRENRTPV